MNLPNRLTMARMIAIPFVLMFMLPIPLQAEWAVSWNAWIGRYGMLIAMVLFSAAAITDTLDGRIARRRGLVTNFGRLLDPIADKLLVLGVLLAFVELGRLHALVIVILLAREFLVTGYRMLALEQQKVLAADWFGKLKTVLQMVAILLMFAELALIGLFDNPTVWFSNLIWYIHIAANLGIVLSVLAALGSGVRYIGSGARIMRT